MIGKVYGRLTVIEDSGSRTKGRQVLWKCLCSCGKEVVVRTCSLKSGNTKSCGCLDAEVKAKRLTKHGKAEHPLYHVWRNMMDRCYNNKHQSYKDYGGRGISVCARWHNLELFIEDMQKGYTKGTQIDRINNNGNYEPANCRWTTSKENARNRRDNTYIEYEGETMAMAAWADRVGIPDYVLHNRLKCEWPIEKALLTPVRKYNKRN